MNLLKLFRDLKERKKLNKSNTALIMVTVYVDSLAELKSWTH